MHPYAKLGASHFWNRSVADRALADVPFDPDPKFRFALDVERFGTAGSCFAQHFGRELVARGGQLLIAEQLHPLVPEDAGHGYGVFSARYGNIYNTRQLRELFEQALGARPPIEEFCANADGRWIDMLRPRAVPDGFSSQADAQADRLHHLRRVRHLLETCSVFVFTLGLTEAWHNHRAGHCYGICPGVVAGSFDPAVHAFVNFDYETCRADLGAALELAWSCNPALKVLLTVSPVMLVATAETRGVVQSSVASKSILRAVADDCVRRYPLVDYFPSYEIIAGPPARGRFFDAHGRDVVPEGVALVMDVFFRSRVHGTARAPAPESVDWRAVEREVQAALQVECDEILLDRPS
jgi:hypothetical protein